MKLHLDILYSALMTETFLRKKGIVQYISYEFQEHYWKQLCELLRN